MVSAPPGPALPPALPGERVRIASSAGEQTLYVLGSGAPLLLIHSINAAASAAEVRPLQEHFSRERQVFCIDLPGYGLSERRPLAYTPQHMIDAIHRAAEHVRRNSGQRPDALALSLSCEYLAGAAAASPESFRSLALVSPTGFRGGQSRRGAPGSTLGLGWFERLLRGPGWGRSLFNGLTRPAVIRYFLRRTWGSDAIDEALWRYDVLTARQPGAEHAPLRFLSGFLFTGDIHTIFEALNLPVWVSHGVRGDFTDYRNRRLVDGRPNWSFTTYGTGALPHFEATARFCADYENFLASV